MFEKLQKIHTKPGTVATFDDNYGKKCCKTQHFRPQQVQKIRGLGVAPGGEAVLPTTTTTSTTTTTTTTSTITTTTTTTTTTTSTTTATKPGSPPLLLPLATPRW